LFHFFCSPLSLGIFFLGNNFSHLDALLILAFILSAVVYHWQTNKAGLQNHLLLDVVVVPHNKRINILPLYFKYYKVKNKSEHMAEFL
jgi:hypothetical protein